MKVVRDPGSMKCIYNKYIYCGKFSPGMLMYESGDVRKSEGLGGSAYFVPKDQG
jgi:hypothetical protein